MHIDLTDTERELMRDVLYYYCAVVQAEMQTAEASSKKRHRGLLRQLRALLMKVKA